MTTNSFLWHDYETFGISPRRDRPAQFAAIRTDDQLNIIGEPVNIYCKPPDDYLPSLGATLITGITPQHCAEHGLHEHAFAAKIASELGAAGTVGVGYNTIRFDDEVTRFLFWRNLIEPYGREWQNGCGRWDIIDVARATYGLRPQGINWPTDSEGKVTFRLSELAKANGLEHDKAHDAMSDVMATLGLARLIREKQPALFEHCLSLRKKDKASDVIGLVRNTPILHVSSYNGADKGCLAALLPLAVHPTNKSEFICWDLSRDPSQLHTMDSADIRDRLYKRSEDLEEGEERIGLRTVAINKSPMVFGFNQLTPKLCATWGFDRAAIDANLVKIEAVRSARDLQVLFKEIYTRDFGAETDVDEDLYGGFLGNNDRRTLDRLRLMPPQALANAIAGFEDERLDVLLFRYRARNFPQTLTADESAQWKAHVHARIVQGDGGHRTFATLLEEIAAADLSGAPHHVLLAEALKDYAATLGQAGTVAPLPVRSAKQGLRP